VEVAAKHILVRVFRSWYIANKLTLKLHLPDSLTDLLCLSLTWVQLQIVPNHTSMYSVVHLITGTSIMLTLHSFDKLTTIFFQNQPYLGYLFCVKKLTNYNNTRIQQTVKIK